MGRNGPNHLDWADLGKAERNIHPKQSTRAPVKELALMQIRN
jgi:hypothetical protein